jgi:hypothetical protein
MDPDDRLTDATQDRLDPAQLRRLYVRIVAWRAEVADLVRVYSDMQRFEQQLAAAGYTSSPEDLERFRVDEQERWNREFDERMRRAQKRCNRAARRMARERLTNWRGQCFGRGARARGSGRPKAAPARRVAAGGARDGPSDDDGPAELARSAPGELVCADKSCPLYGTGAA